MGIFVVIGRIIVFFVFNVILLFSSFIDFFCKCVTMLVD